MKYLFLIRLGLDFTAAGLLLVALAYYWLNNAVHEVVGTGIFLLLISHNIFNRRWWGAVARQRREPRNVVTTAMNLSLLITMLTLLATSIIISETVFSFLPIRSDFTSRQVHAAAAYWALIIVAIHLGWHWHMIAAVVGTRLGVMTSSRLRTGLLRALALCLAAFGAISWIEVGVASKLFMQMSLVGWNFATSTPAFFLHHVAIVGLCASVAHCAMMLVKRRRTNTRATLKGAEAAAPPRKQRVLVTRACAKPQCSAQLMLGQVIDPSTKPTRSAGLVDCANG